MGSAKPSVVIRVLTLERATDRQDRMRQVIECCAGLSGVPWRFSMAIPHDQAGLTYDDAEAYAARGRTLSPAELSCFASHIQILRDWLRESPSDVLMVLEDDLYLDPWFNFKIAPWVMVESNIDFLRFYVRAHAPAKPIAYVGRTQVVRYTWTPGGAQAYMLTRRGAQRIVDAVDKTKRIYLPVDDFYDRPWEVGNGLYALFPSAVLELVVPTTIHSTEQLQQRRVRQAALEQALPKGWSSKLAGKRRALVERLARRRCEQAMSRTDEQVRQKLNVLLASPEVASFGLQAPPAAEAKAATRI